MRGIQKNPDYQAVLKTIPGVLEDYFTENGIFDEEEAMFSPDHVFVASLFPLLKNLSHELEFFYGIPFSNFEEVDNPAAAVFLLNAEINGRLDEDPRFQTIPPILSFDNLAFIPHLHHAFNLAWAQPHDDCLRCFGWLNGLMEVTQRLTDLKINNRKTDIYNQIENSELAYKLAGRFAPYQNMDYKIDELNLSLYQSCIHHLEKSYIIDSLDLTEDVCARLQTQLSQVPPEYIRKEIAGSLPDLVEILQDENLIFNDLLEIRTELKKLEVELVDEADQEWLKGKIFEQSIHEGSSFQSDPNVAISNIKAAVSLENLEFDNGETQEDEVKYVNNLYLQKNFWDKYATSSKIKSDPQFLQAMQVLVGSALYGVIKSDNSQNKSALDAAREDALGILETPDGRMPDQQKSREVLAFCKKVLIISQGAEKYLDCKLVDQSLDYDLLALIMGRDNYSAADFLLPCEFIKSFYQSQNIIVEKINLSKGLSQEYPLFEKIAALPNSQEKFSAAELFYNANVIIQNHSYVMEKQYCQRTLNRMQKVHKTEHLRLSDNISLLSQAYPEVGCLPPERLAQSIDDGVCRNYLFAAYEDKQLPPNGLRDIFESLPMINRFSPEAVNGLYEISEQFIDNVLNRHLELFDNPQQLQCITMPLKRLNDFVSYTDDISSAINKSADLLKEQMPLYLRYRRFGEKIQKIENVPDLNRELLARHRVCRN